MGQRGLTEWSVSAPATSPMPVEFELGKSHRFNWVKRHEQHSQPLQKVRGVDHVKGGWGLADAGD